MSNPLDSYVNELRQQKVDSGSSDDEPNPLDDFLSKRVGTVEPVQSTQPVQAVQPVQPIQPVMPAARKLPDTIAPEVTGAKEALVNTGKGVGAVATGLFNELSNEDSDKVLKDVTGGISNAFSNVLGEPIKQAVHGNFKPAAAQVKGILWDGMIKPLLVNPVVMMTDPTLSPDQRQEMTKETVATALGFFLAEGIGRAIQAVGPEAVASRQLRALTKAKTLPEQLEVISNSISPEQASQAVTLSQEQVGQATQLLSKVTQPSSTSKVIQTGANMFGAGFAFGATTSNGDPDQAFKQAFSNAFAGIFIGAVTHGVGEGKDFILDKAVTSVKQNAAWQMMSDALQTAPGYAISELVKGTPYVKIAANSLEDGKSLAINNVHPDMLKDAPDNVLISDPRENGNHDVLIVGKGLIDDNKDVTYPIPSNDNNQQELAPLVQGNPYEGDPYDKYVQGFNVQAPLQIADKDLSQIGPQAGSNVGGLYQSAVTGKKYYVKFHIDPRQVFAEALSNVIYRKLGINAPNSTLNSDSKGLSIANEYLDNTKQLAETGLTEGKAITLLNGFVADVLTGNRDVLGTGVTALDNVVESPYGQLTRIDQGGTFQFRGMQGEKPKNDWYKILEWDGFNNKDLNPRYAKLFELAKLSGPDDQRFTLDLINQAAELKALEVSNGGWHSFVDGLIGHKASPEVVKEFSDILLARSEVIHNKIGELAKAFENIDLLKDLVNKYQTSLYKAQADVATDGVVKKTKPLQAQNEYTYVKGLLTLAEKGEKKATATISTSAKIKNLKVKYPQLVGHKIFYANDHNISISTWNEILSQLYLEHGLSGTLVKGIVQDIISGALDNVTLSQLYLYSPVSDIFNVIKGLHYTALVQNSSRDGHKWYDLTKPEYKLEKLIPNINPQSAKNETQTDQTKELVNKYPALAGHKIFYNKAPAESSVWQPLLEKLSKSGDLNVNDANNILNEVKSSKFTDNDAVLNRVYKFTNASTVFNAIKADGYTTIVQKAIDSLSHFYYDLNQKDLFPQKLEPTKLLIDHLTQTLQRKYPILAGKNVFYEKALAPPNIWHDIISDLVKYHDLSPETASNIIHNINTGHAYTNNRDVMLAISKNISTNSIWATLSELGYDAFVGTHHTNPLKLVWVDFHSKYLNTEYISELGASAKTQLAKHIISAKQYILGDALKQSLTKSQIDFWKANGFVPNERVTWNGNDVRVTGETEGKKIQIQDLATGLTQYVNTSELARNGQISLIKFAKLENATKQTVNDLSAHYYSMRNWLVQAYEDIKNGKKPDTENAPLFPVVRNQTTPNDLEFSPHRQGTWMLFASANGDNTAYRNDNTTSFSEGGENPIYSLIKLKNPLYLLGSDGDHSSTGSAIIKKLKEDWWKGYTVEVIKEIRQFLAERGLPPEQVDWVEKHLNTFLGDDRLGAELAKAQGYTEVINAKYPSSPEYDGNEFVKLEPPDQYSTIDVYDNIQLPISHYSVESFGSTAQFMKALKDDPEGLSEYLKNRETLNNIEFDKAHELVTSAVNHGLILKRNDVGKLDLYNVAGRHITQFDDLYDAYAHMGQFADPSGFNYLPPPGGLRTGGMWDDDAAFAYNQRKTNFIHDIRTWFTETLPQLSSRYQYFMNLEQKTGRQFFNTFFLPLNKARMKYQAELSNYAHEINPTLARIAQLDPGRRTLISNAQETFSAEELMSDNPTFLHRPLNDDEKRLGVNLGRWSTKDSRLFAYQYIRSESQLKELLENASIQDAQRYTQEFNDNWKPTENQASVIKIFKSILEVNKKDLDLNAVTKLADAISENTLSRFDFYRKHKFTSNETALVGDLDRLYAKFADIFGIDPMSRLGGYLTHMVDYDNTVGDGSLITNSKNLPVKSREFIYSLARTGELSNLIRDPGIILRRYVTAGAKSKFLYPELYKAQTFLKNAYVGLSSGAAEEINYWASRYMSQILGSMDRGDALRLEPEVERGREAFTTAMQKIGVEKLKADKWLRYYMQTSTFAMQGFKPVAGLRDATTISTYFGVRFGAKRLAQMMETWNNALSSKGILLEEGKIPGLNVEFFNTIDGALSKETALGRMANTGFNLSGQPFVYKQFHAMVYLDTVKNTLSALNDFARDGDRVKLEKKLGLWTYDIPVQEEFFRKLNTIGGTIGAAEYLADITGREVVGVYGMANHPAFMDGRFGKFMGQFGQWPLWMLQNIGRLASQGTWKQRLGIAARFGLISGSVIAAGRAVGVNLSNFIFNPAMGLYTGGPMAQDAWWALQYMATNDPKKKDFLAALMQQFSPASHAQPFLPIPQQAYNLMWGMARLKSNDPLHIVGSQMLGIPIDTKKYPKPR